jgi:hypothetical protein
MIDSEWDDERAGERLLPPRAATACLSEEEVEEFLFHRLSGYTRELVEEHLLYCQSCLNRVEHEEGLVNVLRDACGGIEAEDLERSFTKRDRPLWRVPRWSGIGVPVLAIALVGVAIVLAPGMRWQTGPAAQVALQVERGSALGGGSQVPADRSLLLTAQIEGLPALDRYILSLVDANGRQVEEHLVAAPRSTAVSAEFKPHVKGQYWVRLYTPDASRELLREYSILLR